MPLFHVYFNKLSFQFSCIFSIQDNFDISHLQGVPRRIIFFKNFIAFPFFLFFVITKILNTYYYADYDPDLMKSYLTNRSTLIIVSRKGFNVIFVWKYYTNIVILILILSVECHQHTKKKKNLNCKFG